MKNAYCIAKAIQLNKNIGILLQNINTITNHLLTTTNVFII